MNHAKKGVIFSDSRCVDNDKKTVNWCRCRANLSDSRCVERNRTEDGTIDYVYGLLDIPWWCYLISLATGLIVWRVWKRPSLGLLIGYAFLILAETVLIRKPFKGEHLRLELFWSWQQWNVQRNQILTNVIMFVPVGGLAGWLWKWRGLWVAAGLSVTVELLQLVTARGLMEFDDVIHNCLGAVIGIGIVMATEHIRKREI